MVAEKKRKSEAQNALSCEDDLPRRDNLRRGIGDAMMSHGWLMIAALGWLPVSSGAWAAEMSAGDLVMRPNGSADVVVSGSIDGESTFAWTVMLELIPRAGNRGTVAFTQVPAGRPHRRPSFTVVKSAGRSDAVKVLQSRRPGVDIRRLGDAWPGAGSFTAYDTQQAGSNTLNGAVDDNGTFVANSTTFSGPLAVFPVRAGASARGVWDVVLWTAAGESGWEAVQTRLTGGTIVISRDACEMRRDCDDHDRCTDDTCRAGTCEHVRNDAACSEAKPPKNRGRKKRQ